MTTIPSGSHISHYEIGARIGAGGMGEVYRAKDLKLKRDVAIKVLPDSFASDPDRLARFQREAEVLASLNHPNIAAIHGIENARGTLCLVLELVEGETLAQAIARGPLPILDALQIARQICNALEAAHEKGIIHRDLKPGNVMLLPDGKAKVLDFGLAKIFGGSEATPDLSELPTMVSRIEGDEFLGTPPYMSPEQVRGKHLDSRTDIWSFGCVLFELLSGKPTFAGEVTSDIVAKILESKPNWDALPAKTPARIRKLLTRCLQRDPRHRVQHIRDVRWELEDVLNDGGSDPQVSERTFSRRSTILAFATIAIVAVVATIAAIRPDWFRTTGPRLNAVPVVVLMDSPLPERVYDPRTREGGGTNADDITDILRELPVALHKETTSSLWHREDQILRQNPDLIVIHRSCFTDSTNLADAKLNDHLYTLAEAKLFTFLGYIALGNPRTKFVIYSRTFGDDAARSQWTADLENRFPPLKDRIIALQIDGGDTATFRDPASAGLIKSSAVKALNLQ